jgi:hypothetical protein
MNQILKLLPISLCGILIFSTASLSQMMPGPPMMCGSPDMVVGLSEKFKENEFMVLQTDKANAGPYYVLYRNTNTGTWSMIAFNVPNAPPDIICMVQGGYSSYILPDLKEINKMLKKQEDGLDRPNDPDKAPDKET